MAINPTNETLITDLELTVRTANCFRNINLQVNGIQKKSMSKNLSLSRYHAKPPRKISFIPWLSYCSAG